MASVNTLVTLAIIDELAEDDGAAHFNQVAYKTVYFIIPNVIHVFKLYTSSNILPVRASDTVLVIIKFTKFAAAVWLQCGCVAVQ